MGSLINSAKVWLLATIAGTAHRRRLEVAYADVQMPFRSGIY